MLFEEVFFFNFLKLTQKDGNLENLTNFLNNNTADNFSGSKGFI